MFELLGICLVFSVLLLINTVVSASSTLLWRSFGSLSDRLSAAARARVIFWLRILPVAIAISLVVFFLIPSYILDEPQNSGEIVGFKFAIASILSLAGILLAAWRGLRSSIVTGRLIRNWTKNSVAVQIDSVSMPAHCIEHSFPVVAVVGSLRPKLFIARKVIEALSQEELTAALAHETGHMIARDNLKRGLLRACRDVLTLLPCGRFLDGQWSEAAEAAADEYAASAGKSVALDLASALVKIARLVPAGATPIVPAGALLIGNNIGAIAWRVRRLTELAGSGRMTIVHPNAVFRLAICSVAICSLLTVLVLNYQHILLTVHYLSEFVVSIFQ